MKEKEPYREDWEQEAPELASLHGQQPHKVPEGYFEGLPGTIMDRIRAEEGPRTTAPEEVVDTPPIAPAAGRFWNIQRLSIAAGLALLLATGLFFLSRYYQADPYSPPADEMASLQLQLDQLSEEDLLAALEMEDLNDEDVLEVMGDEALGAVDVEPYGQEADAYLEKEVDWHDLDFENLDLEFEDLDDFLQEKNEH